MEYGDVKDEYDENISDDNINLESEENATIKDNVEDLEEEIEGKRNRQANKHILEVRRAIEDHQERTKLRKELDYLFDDDFVDENNWGKG